MSYTITFESSRFSLTQETPNPINPTPGLSIGEWLWPQLCENGIEVSEVEPEDWGWSFCAKRENRTYFIGLVGLPSERPEEPADVMIQVHKKRSLLELLTFKSQLDQNDELVKLIENLVSSINDVSHLEVGQNG